MNTLKEICKKIEQVITIELKEYLSEISAREDSRAFGAMIEKKITENWTEICKSLKVSALEIPGRRSIYDCAFEMNGYTYGLDVKTKDLDSSAYSDGGICAVGNLLKFMANDNGVFLMVEVGHSKHKNADTRAIEYIHVAPFSSMPTASMRIENLGTGQLRLNNSIKEVYNLIEWGRSDEDFLKLFSELTITHYERVANDAMKRINSIRAFKDRGFKDFKFTR